MRLIRSILPRVEVERAFSSSFGSVFYNCPQKCVSAGFKYTSHRNSLQQFASKWARSPNRCVVHAQTQSMHQKHIPTCADADHAQTDAQSSTRAQQRNFRDSWGLRAHTTDTLSASKRAASRETRAAASNLPARLSHSKPNATTSFPFASETGSMGGSHFCPPHSAAADGRTR